MSVVSLLNEYEDFNDFEQLLEDTFGLGIHPGDIYRPYQRSLIMRSSPRRRYNPYLVNKFHRPLRGKPGGLQKSELIPHVTKDGFQVCVDVSQFAPNELTVKTIDRNVIVEGRHEEREDEHGFIQRHFIRKYSLPKGYDPKDVVSTVSSDGILTVKAPLPPSKLKNNERIVQIQQTGPAHLSVKQTEEPKSLENVEADKMETK